MQCFLCAELFVTRAMRLALARR